MAEELGKTPEVPQIKIEPEVGRAIEMVDLAERIAQLKYATSLDGLRKMAEQAGMTVSPKIIEVMSRAKRIVGPEDQYTRDYRQWEETKKAGSHSMNFQEWRKSRNEAYRREYERLDKELDLMGLKK